jgi:hypothetical protein
MKANELVGKEVLRTNPADIGNGYHDYSYTSNPIKILKVTDFHIYYQSDYGFDSILNIRWLDDNWIEYDPPKEL